MARKAKTRFLVLGLLSRRPMSGYDIAAEVAQSISSFWRESFGSIYPMLARLAREGLIRQVDRKRSGRRRRTYGITPRGRTALRRWLAQQPEPDLIRNELLLKLYFGSEIAPGVLLDHVRAYGARQRALLEYLSRAERAVRAAGPEEARQRPYWLMCLALGRRVAQARLEWVGRARAAVGRLTPR